MEILELMIQLTDIMIRQSIITIAITIALSTGIVWLHCRLAKLERKI